MIRMNTHTHTGLIAKHTNSHRHTAVTLWKVLSGCCYCVIMQFVSLFKKIKALLSWQGSVYVSLSLSLFLSTILCCTRYSSPSSMPCQSLNTHACRSVLFSSPLYLFLPLFLVNVILSAIVILSGASLSPSFPFCFSAEILMSDCIQRDGRLKWERGAKQRYVVNTEGVNLLRNKLNEN